MIRVLLQIVGALVALAVLGTVGMAVWARLAPEDPAAWHVDPLTVARATSPNTALLAPEGAAAAAPDGPAPIWTGRTPEEVMAAFAAAVAAAPRTALIAGDPAALHATWRQRSLLMGYPDYVSARALPAEGGATLAIYSRSRFGRSDLGVNAARLSAWLAETSRRLE